MLDLDRLTVGSHLSQSVSKVVLEAFIRCFGFSGVRMDKALRDTVFLHFSSFTSPPLLGILIL